MTIPQRDSAYATTPKGVGTATRGGAGQDVGLALIVHQLPLRA
ncbi:hypothetical protein [Streptomyces canus]|nr:hypothetical protein [Streptomyces canus]